MESEIEGGRDNAERRDLMWGSECCGRLGRRVLREGRKTCYGRMNIVLDERRGD